jgi:hypothetical protein
MFVYLPRRVRYGTVATALAIVGACSPGDQPSDLRPDGPPEVLTVNVPAPDPRILLGEEAPGALIEVPTFCKTQGPNDGAMGAGDPKRPITLQPVDLYTLSVCPADDTMPVPEITTADPSTWYVRIEFDELLDGSVEDLVPILDADGNPTGTFSGTLANTQPVTLQCQSSIGNGDLVDVAYDGYYSPAGNSQSYPLGPSLVIQPADPTLVATQSECDITIKDSVKDQQGNPVPMDQRGPYKFKLGAITAISIAPPDGSMVDPVAAGADVTFNMAFDPSTFSTNAFSFTPTVANTFASAGSMNDIFFGGDFPSGSSSLDLSPYTFALLAGATVQDQCGKTTTFGAPVDGVTQTTFSLNPLMLMGITGADNPGDMINLSFNQYMDATTLLPADFSVTPVPANEAVLGGGPTITIYGNYKLATQYTFTLNASAAIKDCPGNEADPATGACTVASSDTYSGAAQTLSFTTASSILLTDLEPMDNSTATAGPAEITMTFNQEMDFTTLTAADYTIDPPVALTSQEDSFETLGLTGTFAPGNYTFTLLGTASISDFSGGTFSPGTDQVIHITVTPAPTGGPTSCL